MQKEMRPYLVQHLLEECALNYPDKIFAYSRKGALKYSQALNQSKRLAGKLSSLGIKKGDRVGIFLDKSLELVVSTFGIFYAGGIIVIINPVLSKEQIRHIVKGCQIESIITSSDKFSKFFKFFSEIGIKDIVDVKEGLGNKKIKKEIRQIGDDAASIIYTSGSTGLVKGIVVSHRNLIDGAKIVSSYLGIEERDVLIGILPLNFDYGFNQLMDVVYRGATLYLHDFYFPNDLLDALEREKITVFAGMVPVWTKIFNSSLTNLRKIRDLSQLRIITNTGGKVPIPIVKKMIKYFRKTKIFLMYGLTEAFRSTYLPPEEIRKRPDSIGKAIPGVDIYVINKDGRECKFNEIGELVHRGSLVAKGYWNNSEETNKVFRANPLLENKNQHLERVVFSGDLVKKDKDDFLYYIGREDEILKISGYRVSPMEAEEIIYRLSGISECVVFGVKKDNTAYLRALVTLKDNKITTEAVKNHCRKNGPGYLIPKEVIILRDFSYNSNGKIDREKLRKKYSK